MKKFDLDQIKNRQLQEMPDDFYEKMQQTVVDKTILKKKSLEVGKKSSFNWFYAVAASFALIFGGTYIFNNDDVAQDKIVTKTQTFSESFPDQNKIDDSSATTTRILTIAEPIKNKELISEKPKENFNTNTSPQEILAKTKIKKTTKLANPTKASKPEEQIDIILANFSAEELATLAKNSDQDVYLDLYN